MPSKLYDKRIFDADQIGIISQSNGFEYDKKTGIRIKPIYNKNILGYMIVQSFLFENPRLKVNFTRLPVFNGNGFYLRSDSYLEKLPLFAAGKYPIEDRWYENGVIATTSDGGDKYIKDKDFLKTCFIFTCLSRYNKCISFTGSDNRFYKNELCFDVGTLASDQVSKYHLNQDEKELIKIWESVLSEAKNTKNYNGTLSYGPYQIEIELNTFHKDDKDKKVYHYSTLNGELDNLKKKLKSYYAKYIIDKLFEYELLK